MRKQRCLLPALARHSHWGTVSFCELSSPLQPCCLGRLLLGQRRPGSSSHGTASPFALLDIAPSLLRGFISFPPSSRDWLLFSFSRGKSKFVWLCSIPWRVQIFFFFHFFCKWGKSVGTFFCPPFAQEESAAGSGEVEERAWLWNWLYCLAGETLSFVTLGVPVLKGSSYLVFSEKTGSGGQRELYLTGRGRLAVWMLSQAWGFVYGSMKNSPSSVIWVVPPPLPPMLLASKEATLWVLDPRKLRNT